MAQSLRMLRTRAVTMFMHNELVSKQDNIALYREIERMDAAAKGLLAIAKRNGWEE